jgi:hypothetical protein
MTNTEKGLREFAAFASRELLQKPYGVISTISDPLVDKWQEKLSHCIYCGCEITNPGDTQKMCHSCMKDYYG